MEASQLLNEIGAGYRSSDYPLVRDIEKVATLAEGLINLGEYQAGYRHLYELVSTYGSTYDLNIESENNYISSAGLVSFFPL